MSFLKKLQEQFRSQPANAQPSQPTNPTQTAQPTNGAPASQGQATFENPLDFYGHLSQNTPTSTKTAPEFAIPSETIQKAAGSLDFAKSVPQDIIAKLQAGDMSAFAEALNIVGRQAYASAIEHSSALTNKFVGDRLAFESEGFDQRISSKLVTSGVKSIDSLHPQAQSMFRDNMERLRQQYPSATQQDLEGATWELMESLGKQFTRNDPAQQQQQQSNKVVDYDALAGYEPEQAPSGAPAAP